MGYSHSLAAALPHAAVMTLAGGPARRSRPRDSGIAARSDCAPPPPADPQSDLAGMLARMAEGDERALVEFHARTAAKAYGLALRIVGGVGLAEEVVVDTFHQAWREARRFDAARGSPMAWLLMMCRSRALDALRGRDPALLHEDPGSLVDEADAAHDRDPLDLLAAVEAHTALHVALAELSAAQRQMVALAFFRGFTHEEIAAHARVPLGTVKSQIRRALDVLRRALAPAGVTP